MIEYRRMNRDEVYRIRELDRSEHVTAGYAVRDGQLRAEAVDWRVPNWNPQGDGPHSMARRVAATARVLEGGGVAVGAFDGGTLVGCATLRFRLTQTMAQLAGLCVSRDYRRQGIATRLVTEVLRLARESGASEIYVSATPSESAVGFYQSLGFAPAPKSRIHPELYAEEPEDIHMTRCL